MIYARTNTLLCNSPTGTVRVREGTNTRLLLPISALAHSCSSAELPKMTSGFRVRRATAEDDATFWTLISIVHMQGNTVPCDHGGLRLLFSIVGP